MMSLDEIKNLREIGKNHEAHLLAEKLANDYPGNAEYQYEAACINDYLGYENDAISYYERAISNGLNKELLRNAYVGLGSTLRAMGEYEKAEKILRDGLKTFPRAREIRVFLAMTLYNLEKHKESTKVLLRVLTQTTKDKEILSYKGAIAIYAKNLDKTWP